MIWIDTKGKRMGEFVSQQTLLWLTTTDELKGQEVSIQGYYKCSCDASFVSTSSDGNSFNSLFSHSIMRHRNILQGCLVKIQNEVLRDVMLLH